MKKASRRFPTVSLEYMMRKTGGKAIPNEVSSKAAKNHPTALRKQPAPGKRAR